MFEITLYTIDMHKNRFLSSNDQPPIYRLTTAVSDIDQTNINRDIRDGNWLSSQGRGRSDYTHDGDDVGNRAFANCVNNDGIEY